MAVPIIKTLAGNDLGNKLYCEVFENEHFVSETS